MFQISALRRDDFTEFLSLDDEALERHGAKRYIADRKPGFPCRVTLEDAEPGERVVLLPFRHQSASSPYGAIGPIFVRESAQTASVPPDVVPGVLRTRLLSVRAYDAADLMTEAAVVEGRELEPVLNQLLERADVSYLHIHFARPGCYACRVDRRGPDSPTDSH
jgi:hypothetical protein